MNREQLHDRVAETLCAAEYRWRRPTGVLGVIVSPQIPPPLVEAMAAAVVDLIERLERAGQVPAGERPREVAA